MFFNDGTTASSAYKLGKTEGMHLDLNEFDFMHHTDVVSCLNMGETFISKYDSEDTVHFELIELLSTYVDAPTENIMLLNGCDAGIKLIIDSCRFNRVCIHTPAYRQYERMSTLRGKEMLFCSEDTLMSFTPEQDLVFICSPSQPAGRLHHSKVMEYVEKYPDSLFVVDESYLDYVTMAGEENIHSLSRYTTTHHNLIVLKSLSKAFGLAGMRIGYLVSHSQNVHEFEKAFNHKDVLAISKLVALKAMHNIDWYKQCTADMIRNREILVDLMHANHEHVTNTKCNFILLRNAELYDFLLKHGIVIRRVVGDMFRMTVPGDHNLKQVVQILNKFFVLRDVDVWCICLKERDEKYQLAAAEFQTQQILDRVNWHRPERDPRGGEYGCWESHRHCMKSSKKAYSLIFEDDVKFTRDIDWNVLREAMYHRDAWDTFYLGCTITAMHQEITPEVWLMSCNQAHAYVIRNNLAKTPDFAPTEHQGGVDDYYRRYTRQYGLIRPVCIQRGGVPSDNEWFDVHLFQPVFQHARFYEFFQKAGNTIARCCAWLPTKIQPWINPVAALLFVNIGLQNGVTAFRKFRQPNSK